MSRFSTFILVLSVGLGVHQSNGVEVKVNDMSGNLCLYANLMVNFSISYEMTDKTMSVAELQLPSNVVTNGSCGSNSSEFKLDFETGHSWAMTFKTNGKTYEADSLVFSYNLNDSKVFPNSSSNATVQVNVKPSISDVPTDTSYSCRSSQTVQKESVNQTLWNVVIQAFITNGNQSTNMTSCAADTPTPTPTPTKPVTTPSPPPPTTPTPTLPDPTFGKYNVTPENGTTCLLAQFGLRLGFKLGGKYQEMNLNGSNAHATGLCGGNISELQIESETMTIKMAFTNDTKKFRLRGLDVTVTTSSGAKFKDGNSTLNLWEASVGNSYMCNKEQNYTITKDLSLFTFQLRVQPFGVKKADYSTAQECSLDDTSILIPIIVGAALAGLILVVVIAYVIGRRKTYVGYQTL